MEKTADETPHTILVFDLSPQMRAILHEWLEEKGYVTIAAAEGVELAARQAWKEAGLRSVVAALVLQLLRGENGNGNHCSRT